MNSFAFALFVAVAATSAAAFPFQASFGGHQGQLVPLSGDDYRPMATGQFMNKGDSNAKYNSRGQAQGTSYSTGRGNAYGNALDSVVFDGKVSEYGASNYDTVAKSTGASNTKSQQEGNTNMKYAMNDGYGYASAEGQSSQSFKTVNDAAEKYDTSAIGKESYGSNTSGALKSINENKSQWTQDVDTTADAQFAAEDATQAQAVAAFKDQQTTHESNVPSDAAANGFPLNQRVPTLQAALPVSKHSAAAYGEEVPYGFGGAAHYSQQQPQQYHQGYAAPGFVYAQQHQQQQPINAGQFVAPNQATVVPQAHTGVVVNGAAGTAASYA